MEANRVSNMTIEQLKELIQHEFDERMGRWFARPDPSTVAETLDWFDQNRWTPPPGSPSPLDMLREDRER